jgi:hypothetical protein
MKYEEFLKRDYRLDETGFREKIDRCTSNGIIFFPKNLSLETCCGSMGGQSL